MMRIAVVGSRTWTDRERIAAFIAALPPDTVIVSGGARGADRLAEVEAGFRKLARIIIRPEWDKYGPAAGPIRNKAIVDQADRLVAFWDGRSQGTRHAITLAEKKGIPITVHHTNGTVTLYAVPDETTRDVLKERLQHDHE